MTALGLARAADRSIPALLRLLLVALTVSITAIDALTALLIAATLVALIDPRARARYRLPLVLPMLAFAAVTLVSAAASTERAVAFFESKHLLAFVLFPIAVNGFESGASPRRALGWFFAAVSLVALHAILQTLACGSSVGLPPWVAWALRVKLEACRAAHPFRAKGFFSIYMTLGGSLMIALSLLLATLTVEKRPRPWLIVPTALAVVVLGFTYVRNAWLGLGVAMVVLTALSRRLWLVAPVALGVLIALALPSPVRTRIVSMLDPADPTVRQRLDFWDAGGRMVRDAPLLGVGPGGVHRYYPEYKRPDAAKQRTGHLHNNLVQIAAERGLLGLAAWLWIWVAFFSRAGRIYGALPPTRGDDRALVAGSIAAVAGFLAAGLFEYNFGDSEVIDLLWVVMAFPFVCSPEAPTESADAAPSARVAGAAA